MEYTLKNYKKRQNTEPDDKYSAHFEYHDLYQRLLILKRQREHQSNNDVFKSFENDTHKSPSNASKARHKSKISLRNNSVSKNPKRGISSDFIKITKIYSPTSKPKVISTENLLTSIKFPRSILAAKTLKRRGSRLRMINQKQIL